MSRVPPYSRYARTVLALSPTGLSPALAARSSGLRLARGFSLCGSHAGLPRTPFNPAGATAAPLARQRFGLAPFRSPLLRPCFTSSGYMRCFSSPAYLHTAYIFNGGSPGSSPGGVSPFGHPRLPARARLPEAFRCYATSFVGTNDLGIHPTPFVTVIPTARGRPRRRTPVSLPFLLFAPCPRPYDAGILAASLVSLLGW